MAAENVRMEPYSEKLNLKSFRLTQLTQWLRVNLGKGMQKLTPAAVAHSSPPPTDSLSSRVFSCGTSVHKWCVHDI